MKLRDANPNDLRQIDRAMTLLREARARLGKAQARQAVSAVARALKSVEGARRHAQRIVWNKAGFAVEGECPHGRDLERCRGSCRHHEHGSEQTCGDCDGWGA